MNFAAGDAIPLCEESSVRKVECPYECTQPTQNKIRTEHLEGAHEPPGVLKILAEGEVRFKETLVELRKRAWLMTPDPLCSASRADAAGRALRCTDDVGRFGKIRQSWRSRNR